jgi:hypothetical protein
MCIQVQCKEPAAPRIYDIGIGCGGTAPSNILSGRLITIYEPEDMRQDLDPRFKDIEGRIEKLEKSESKGIAKLDERLTKLVADNLNQELKDYLIAEISKEIEARLESRLKMIETRLQEVEHKTNGQ